MLDFKKLKSVNSLEKLQKAVEEQSKKTYANSDSPDEYWRPSVDKSGNGTAKIRFMPSPPQDGEDGLPWIKYWRYNFQGPGGYYINNSLGTFNKPDPCKEYNDKLYASKIEENEKQAKKQNRTQTICCNVLILDDPLHPENKGLVRKYKFGVKIWNKIQAAMDGDPDDADVAKFNPFDFYEGADFKIKIKTIKVGNDKAQPNYDDSAFLTPKPLSKDDTYLEETWKKCFSLQEMLSDKHFKTYDQLLKDLTRCLGFNPLEDSDKPKTPVKTVSPKVETPKVETKVEEEDTPPWEDSKSIVTDDDDDDLKAFRQLADE
jgi:gp32 DNA binding protein like